MWEQFFKRELDIEKFEEFAPILESVGLSAADFKRYSRDRWCRVSWTAALAEGEHDEVFGVPTLMVDGEPFWGNDRITWVVRKLDAMGLRRN